MRTPIKPNQCRMPQWTPKWLPTRYDPRKLLAQDTRAINFERCVTAIKIGSTWRTTEKQRHVLSDRLIAAIASSQPFVAILDVGASSGSTSLALLDCLKSKRDRYYVTDLFLHIRCAIQNGVTYFYHPLDSRCIMCVSDWFIVYNDTEGAVPPLGFIARRWIARAPDINSICAVTVSLLHPDLEERARTDPRITIHEYDVFERWPHEPVDIVKVANLLNRSYFSEADIVRALTNLKNALKPTGRIVVTENRHEERVSVLAKGPTGSLVIEKQINGGSEIAALAAHA